MTALCPASRTPLERVDEQSRRRPTPPRLSRVGKCAFPRGYPRRSQLGRHRRWRDHRAFVRILRFLRIRHRLRAGFSGAALPVSSSAARHPGGVWLARGGFHHPPHWHRAGHGRPAALGPWYKTDAGAVRIGQLHSGHGFHAGLCDGGQAGDRDHAGAASGPGPGARRCVGWFAVAAGDVGLARAPRLVRDDRPAGRAAGLHHRSRAVRLPAFAADHRRFPELGLALPILRGLCRQRGGAVRAAASGGRPRLHTPHGRERIAARACYRSAAPRGWTRISGRLRRAGQFCAVPPGHGVSAFLDHAERAAVDQRGADRADFWRHPGVRGGDRLGLVGRSGGAPHAAGLHGGADRRVQPGGAVAVEWCRRGQHALSADRFRPARPVVRPSFWYGDF